MAPVQLSALRKSAWYRVPPRVSSAGPPTPGRISLRPRSPLGGREATVKSGILRPFVRRCPSGPKREHRARTAPLWLPPQL